MRVGFRRPASAVACAVLRGAMALALVLPPLGARAADPGPPPAVAAAPAAQDLWIVTLTGTIQAGPRYPGSDRFSLSGYPSLSYRRAGEPARFSAPDDGLSIALVDTGWFRAGPVARFQGGRYRDADPDLFGLRKVRWAVEPGAFVEFWPTQWVRARFEIRHGVHGHDGFVANAGIDVVHPIGPLTLSVGPRLALGDDAFTGTYFGVTPFEAALNPFVHPYRARGGLTSVGLLGAATYVWSPQWATTLYAGYDRLVGDAGDSPITRRIGSPNQFTVGARLSYSFAMPALF